MGARSVEASRYRSVEQQQYATKDKRHIHLTLHNCRRRSTLETLPDRRKNCVKHAAGHSPVDTLFWRRLLSTMVLPVPVNIALAKRSSAGRRTCKTYPLRAEAPQEGAGCSVPRAAEPQAWSAAQTQEREQGGRAGQ